jgi:type VI secretion system secreted protein VgrG
MAIYTQTQRPLAANTPLGNDILLLTRFRGHEAISQPFNFQLDLLAEAKNEIPFDRILGQDITVEMRLGGQEKPRFGWSRKQQPVWRSWE